MTMHYIKKWHSLNNKKENHKWWSEKKALEMDRLYAKNRRQQSLYDCTIWQEGGTPNNNMENMANNGARMKCIEVETLNRSSQALAKKSCCLSLSCEPQGTGNLTFFILPFLKVFLLNKYQFIS